MAELNPEKTDATDAEVIPPVEAKAHVNAPRTRSKKEPAAAEPVELVEPDPAPDRTVVEPVETPVVEPVETCSANTRA